MPTTTPATLPRLASFAAQARHPASAGRSQPVPWELQRPLGHVRVDFRARSRLCGLEDRGDQVCGPGHLTISLGPDTQE
jgi:hypothetical protein